MSAAMLDTCASDFAHGRRAVCMLSLLTSGRAAAPEVGTAVLIKPQVTGKLENEERRLETGSRVHRSELLKAGPQAQAELRLANNTTLALDPDAELVLDEYAVGSGTDTMTIALKILKGTPYGQSSKALSCRPWRAARSGAPPCGRQDRAVDQRQQLVARDQPRSALLSYAEI
jgi:hypothetical protein